MDAPSDLPVLPVDPESLAGELAREPAIFAYWQAMAEDRRAQLEALKNKRDYCRTTAFLNASGPVEVRKAVGQADPDAEGYTQEIEQVEHRYRQALNEMTASDVRMTAIKKILSWRIEESHNLAMGEQPTGRRVAGTVIHFPDKE